jgi:hypothetical protein
MLSKAPGDERAEARHPYPDRLVGHDDAALGQQPRDIAKAQRERA